MRYFIFVTVVTLSLIVVADRQFYDGKYTAPILEEASQTGTNMLRQFNSGRDWALRKMGF
jgi:hypothetical protein